MAEELKDSETVTALSVVGFVFGLIGMLGSFIPCLGSLAFYIGIPAAIVSGIALGVAYSQNAKRTFAIVALTISLVGVVISGWQYFSIISAGKKANQSMEDMARPSTRTQTETPTPRQPISEPGPQVAIITKEAGNENAEAARKIFHTTYVKLLKERNNYSNVINLKNDRDWRTKEIKLLKGAENLVKIEGPSYGIVVMLFNKKLKFDNRCNGSYKPLVGFPEKTGNPEPSYLGIYEEDNKTLCWQFIFEPFYRDEKLELLLPATFQHDFKISLRDAELMN
jgi:hypothetical protein